MHFPGQSDERPSKAPKHLPPPRPSNNRPPQSQSPKAAPKQPRSKPKKPEGQPRGSPRKAKKARRKAPKPQSSPKESQKCPKESLEESPHSRKAPGCSKVALPGLPRASSQDVPGPQLGPVCCSQRRGSCQGASMMNSSVLLFPWGGSRSIMNSIVLQGKSMFLWPLPEP